MEFAWISGRKLTGRILNWNIPTNHALSSFIGSVGYLANDIYVSSFFHVTIIYHTHMIVIS